MNRFLPYITFLVKDYDEAIDYFTKKIQFRILEDTKKNGGKRWILISPGGNAESSLLLAKASNDLQKRSVGNQAGGRVAFFLHTDNFDEDYSYMKDHGVEFLEEPRIESYGKVVVFKDLYGNKWDFLQLTGI